MTDSIREAQRTMIAQTLRGAPMFAGLPESELARLAESCRLKRAPKGTYLFRWGQPVEGFFIVHSGAVNIHRITQSGREQVIRVFYPGETFGEMFVARDGSYPASARTIEDSQVIMAPAAFFRQEIHRNPDFALRIVASMGTHLRYLIDTIDGLKLQQAESRVIHWLLRQVETLPTEDGARPTLTLPLAKNLLASQLGITSETLSRVFARLRSEGFIEIEGKQIQFLDLSSLRDSLLYRECDTPGQR